MASMKSLESHSCDVPLTPHLLMHKLLALVVALALFTSTGTAQVITVGPGGTYANIQVAINASPAGSILFVQPGTYAAFTLNKPLDIIGPGSGNAVISNGFTVSNLPAGTTSLISGFKVKSKGTTCFPTQLNPTPNCTGVIQVKSGPGAITFADIVADMQADTKRTGVTMKIVDSHQVQLQSCILSGESFELHTVFPATSDDDLATTALDISTSTVRLVDCQLTGGQGGTTVAYLINHHHAGSTPLVASASTVELYRTAVFGGSGGSQDVPYSSTKYALRGLPGISASQTTLRLLGGTGAVVQAGDPPCIGDCVSGTDAVSLTLGSVVELVQNQALAPSLSCQYSGCPYSSDGVPIGLDGTSTEIDLPYFMPSIKGTSTTLALGASSTINVNGDFNQPFAAYLALDITSPLPIAGIEGSILIDLASANLFAAIGLDPVGFANLPFQIPADATLLGLQGNLQGIQLGPLLKLTNVWTFTVH